MNRKLLFLPLILVIAICGLLLAGLQQDPRKISSALIDKAVPEFYLADLIEPQQQLTHQHLPQQWYILNVWASWCTACKIEHPFLTHLSQQNIAIVGLNYRDKRQNALEMLAKMGNPFTLNLFDPQGLFALNLGVDGAPETYLVDQYGIIRYRHSGLLDQQSWQQHFVPIIAKWTKNEE